MIILGTAAFLLMLLGDINDAVLGRRLLRLCFPIGLIMLAAATGARITLKGANLTWSILAVAFLLLLLYALFGSFPVKEAYATQDTGRQVCDSGFYAMCRHPGVLFFAGLYISLHFAVALPLADALIYTGLDLLLAFAEDVWIFPKTIGGYGEYKKRVPFIIPRADGIKKIFKR